MSAHLSSEEQALFLAQMADVTPLRAAQRADLSVARNLRSNKFEVRRHPPFENADLPPLALADRLDNDTVATYSQPGISAQTLRDLRRGRWRIQQEIDLHGYTRDTARQALSQFLSQSLYQELRCVRIVTGQGWRSPGQIAVLRDLTRNWLTQCHDVLAYCPAQPADGGHGALIVLLRNVPKTKPRQSAKETV